MPMTQEALNELIDLVYGQGSGPAGPTGPQSPEEYLMSLIQAINTSAGQNGVTPFLPADGWRYSPDLFPVEIPSNGVRWTSMPTPPFDSGVPQGRIPPPTYPLGVPQGRIPVPFDPGVPQGKYPMSQEDIYSPNGAAGPSGPVGPPAPPFLPASGWRYTPSSNPVNIPASGTRWTSPPPTRYPAGVPQGRLPAPTYPTGVPQGIYSVPVSTGVPQGRYPMPAPPTYPTGVPQGRIPAPTSTAYPNGGHSFIPTPPPTIVRNPAGNTVGATSNTGVSRPSGTTAGGYPLTSGGSTGVGGSNVPQSPITFLNTQDGRAYGGRWTPAADAMMKANAIDRISGAAVVGGEQGADVSSEEALWLSTPEGQAYTQQRAASAQAAAAQRAAQQQYYTGLLSGLDQQTATVNAGFDQRKQAIADLLAQSGTRLTDILGTLGTQTQAAGAATSQAYTDAQTRQAALQQEFAASEAARAAGQAQTLGAFGVAPTGIERQYAPAQMVEAQRAALAQQQAADAALYANRGAVQAGLSSDVSTRNSQQAQLLQAQLDYQRQLAAQQAAQQRAQLAAQAAAAGVNL